jgi:uncharacterized protein (TIGR02453 family)
MVPLIGTGEGRLATAEFAGFPAAAFAFLSGIATHNDKAWFDAHRTLYEEGYVAPARAFVAALGPRLRDISAGVQFEPKVNGSLSRINRDIRFSKDKRPYKTHLDIWFWHGERKSWSAPGFWFRLTPEAVMLGSGMHGLADDALEAFRQSVVHPRSAKTLLSAVEQVRAAGPYAVGEKTRKKLPRGYPADGPAAEFLLHESLHAGIDLPAEAARKKDFLDVCVGHYRAIWPISQWLLDEVSGH